MAKPTSAIIVPRFYANEPAEKDGDDRVRVRVGGDERGRRDAEQPHVGGEREQRPGDDQVGERRQRLAGEATDIDVAGLTGHFIAPIVLTGVTHDMRIMREEIFGPVVPIVTVESEDEAIALANDSEFGLGASVWTMNRAKGERIAGRLQSGMVWINDHMFSHGVCSCSWGGVKESGLGRSHSKFGLWECVNVKLVTWEPSRTRDFWWHPYDERLGKALNASAKLLYGRDSDKPGALRRGLLPMLRVSARTLRRKA